MKHILLFGNFGIGELLVIALIILLVFGGKKIPELMKGLGKGVKSFKDGVNGIENEAKNESKSESNFDNTNKENK